MIKYYRGDFMDFYKIISNLKFLGIKNYKEMEIENLTCNSKDVLNNSIYFCINGYKNDGHTYAEESVKNGAVCLVVEKYLDIPTTQILVENVRVAMSRISSIFYGTNCSKMKFIGITGTNGKTTTTFILKDILCSMGKRVGLIGTEGTFIEGEKVPSELTTPDPIQLHKLINQMEENGCEFCIMEVSAHAIALNKIDDIMYDVVGLTNITQDHLDFFVNMENYIKCKSLLISSKHAKSAVINIDAKYNKDIAKKGDLIVNTIGKTGQFAITDLKQNINNTSFIISHNEKEYKVKTNLIGKYNAYNLTMAIATLNQLGFEIKDILSIVKQFQFDIPGRFNIINTDFGFNVVIDYAHTPDGIKNILTSIKELPVERIITVFGCGGNRDRTKRNEMGKIANSLSDFVIVTSDNPRDENPETIIDEIVEGINSKSVVRITDRKSAIDYALNVAKQNDIVAILGKGNESYQEIKGVKNPFNDFEVVNNHLKYKIKREFK